MADDLVVRAEDARAYAEMAKTWTITAGGEEDDVTRIGNLARAYLERAAQLAAMTAERDHIDALAVASHRHNETLVAQLTASEAARGEALLQRDEAEKVLAETADVLSDLRFNVWGSRAEAALAKADAIVCQAQAALAEPGKAGES